MKTLEIENDVWTALKERAQSDVVLRGLLALIREKTTGSNSMPSQPVASVSQTGSAKQIGREHRDHYAKLHGMKHEKGVVYLSGAGNRVVLPFATERNQDHWFMGAPRTLFQTREKPALVLLCLRNGELLDFAIPSGIVAEVFPLLTANKQGLLMFNVARRGEAHYELLVRGSSRDISKYLHTEIK